MPSQMLSCDKDAVKYLKIFGRPCPSQDHIFTRYLTQIYFIPIGKTVVISHTYELKAAVISPPLLCQAVLLSVLCVVVYSEVWGLSHPEGLIRADVGTGCIKL